MSEGAHTNLKIVVDGLNFLNSYWMFYSVNVEINNCNAASLMLDFQNIRNVTIENCTLGNWTFVQVQNAFIKNCKNLFAESSSTLLRFYNSSAFVQNMTIEYENITDFYGILVDNSSLLHVEQSKFVKNTVTMGIIQVLNSSTLIMSNCNILRNHAKKIAGAIYAKASAVFLIKSYFNSNKAISDGGAIYIIKTFLQIENCTFRNNRAHEAFEGAIVSLYNSSLDLSNSIFDGNKASQGAAIHQQTGKTKLNKCSFLGNSKIAMSGLDNSRITIMNSIFQNNLAKYVGGAVAMNKSALNVLNTTFRNNTQISDSIQDPIGGGAIYISNCVGNISKSTFENNVAGRIGGAICSLNSSINIKYSKFVNKSVLNKVIGRGGGLFLYENSTIKISNVFLSKCYAAYGAAIGSDSTIMIMMSNSSVVSNTGSAITLSTGDTFEMNNCTFLKNWTPGDGGVIYCIGPCVVKMINTKFGQNRAVRDGGAVFLSVTNREVFRTMSNLTAHNCSFINDTADTGGAMLVSHSVVNIVDSNFSRNTATEGTIAVVKGNLVVTNCRISNNIVHQNGGFINALNGSLLMSNCLVFNNTANSDGGVVNAVDFEIAITTSIFKMNRALERGGVFYVTGGTMLLRNSSFAKNVAELSGGVLVASSQAVINISQSFCYENKAEYSGSVIFSRSNAEILISDTNISHNYAYLQGAMRVDGNSILKIYRSLIEGNNAEIYIGTLSISNSLLVAVNSSFKGNSAYQDSSISIFNSTVYLEKCNFLENQLTQGGTISPDSQTTLKVSNTVFTQNDGYDISYHFIRKFETYNCLFKNENVSLKSNVKNFEEVALEEKFIGDIRYLNQSVFKPLETPYASSKIYLY